MQGVNQLKNMESNKLKSGNQVIASLKNVREQRLLEKRMKEIENLWSIELKSLTHERLDVTREYTKLEDDKRNAEYLDEQSNQHKKAEEKRRIESVKEYSEYMHDSKAQKKRHKYLMEKYDFKAHEREKKLQVHVHEVEKPLAIMKENGLVQSLPPIPDKPRLARSNSIVGELIKAKSSSESNIPSVDFGLYLQRNSKPPKAGYLSLPDIREERLGGSVRKRDISLTAIPDIDELPEMPTKKKFVVRRRVASVTNICMEPRRHTVL